MKRSKEAVMVKKSSSKNKKAALQRLATLTDVEIDDHPLLTGPQMKLCKELRNLAKRGKESFTLLDFASIALRATGNDYAEVTGEGGPEAAKRDYEHQRAAILFVYESIKAGPPIVSETAEQRGTLKDLELLASHL
jgi:hypothetical protein